MHKHRLKFSMPDLPARLGNMSSLKKLTIRGMIWTIAGYGASQILRFGSNLILTRLLFPELFGLMTLVNTFIVGLHLFSDVGIGPSIIQNKRGDDPAFLNTAWTVQVIRGWGLWFCCILIAWPLAELYGEPQLRLLIPIVGLATVISGFDSTARFTLNRQIAMGQLAIFELGGQIVGLTVMIVWAWLSPTVWALVIGGLVSSLVQMVWSYQLAPDSVNCFAWDREAVKDLLSFGRWIFISTALTFLATQADRLILGKLIPLDVLGVYGVAFALSEIPRSIFSAISGKVLFPAFSKLVDLPRETFRAKIQKNRKPLLIAAALGLTMLVSFGDILISVLYDERYIQAGWMLPLLALGFWPRILIESIDRSLFALGKPGYSAYGSFFKFLCIVVGLPLGFSLMGLAGAVIVIALSDLPFYGAVTYGLWREGLSVMVQDIQITTLLIGLLTVVLIGRAVLGFGLPISGLL